MGNGLDTIYFIMLIVGGLFGVSDYFAAKSEKMKNFVDKIIPAQGVIGMILAVMSVIEFIRAFWFLKYSFFLWLTFLYIILLSVLLGVILSYKLIVKLFLSKNEEVQEKTEKVIEKIQLWQTPLGWINFSNGIVIILFMASMNGLIRSALGSLAG